MRDEDFASERNRTKRILGKNEMLALQRYLLFWVFLFLPCSFALAQDESPLRSANDQKTSDIESKLEKLNFELDQRIESLTNRTDVSPAVEFEFSFPATKSNFSICVIEFSPNFPWINYAIISPSQVLTLMGRFQESMTVNVQQAFGSTTRAIKAWLNIKGRKAEPKAETVEAEETTSG